jgi:hypothetical protein
LSIRDVGAVRRSALVLKDEHKVQRLVHSPSPHTHTATGASNLPDTQPHTRPPLPRTVSPLRMLLAKTSEPPPPPPAQLQSHLYAVVRQAQCQLGRAALGCVWAERKAAQLVTQGQHQEAADLVRSLRRGRGGGGGKRCSLKQGRRTSQNPLGFTNSTTQLWCQYCTPCRIRCRLHTSS